MLQYYTILGSGSFVKHGILRTNTYDRILDTGSCCKSMTYGIVELYDNSSMSYVSIDKDMLVGVQNTLQSCSKHNCCNTNTNITQEKGGFGNSDHVNNCLNVEAPCFVCGLHEICKFNIFAPVFVPRSNRNLCIKGETYINNAGLYVTYNILTSVNDKYTRDDCVCVSGMCDDMEACTNGFITKNQTLVHNVLMSSLDGDPSCGGDIFHDTSCPKQFEYRSRTIKC